MFAINYVAALLLLVLGAYGAFTHRNLIRMLLNIGLINGATCYFLVTLGYQLGNSRPIAYDLQTIPSLGTSSDPFILALAWLSLLVGVITWIIALVLIMYAAKQYHTIDRGRLRVRPEQ